MATLYENFLSGTLDADPGASGTSISSPGLSALPAVSGSDRMWLVLDPEGVGGAPEVVQVTAHTASATTATVTRAQQSTTGRTHAIGTEWCVAWTKSDADGMPSKVLTTTGDLMYASAANTPARLAVGAANRVLFSNGTTPEYGQVTAAMLATALSNLLVPAGTVAFTIASSAPTGWLFHDQAVAGCDSTYPDLWSKAPAGWKSGTTLNIPDLTDMAIMQAGTTVLGATGGANSVTIAETNLPAHTHSINHDHAAVTSGAGSAHTHSFSGTTSSDGSHTHEPYDTSTDFVSQVAGGGSVFASGSGVSVAAAGTTASSGAHTHTVSGTTGSEGVHTHSVDVANHTGSSGSVGSGTALATTPAHVAFNIMIKAH